MGIMSTEETRRDLRERIDTFIRRCEMKRMPPDRWEAHWVTVAIAHWCGGNFDAGETAMRHAETPYRLRPETDMPMIARHLTIEELRSIFVQFAGPG